MGREEKVELVGNLDVTSTVTLHGTQTPDLRPLLVLPSLTPTLKLAFPPTAIFLNEKLPQISTLNPK